MVRLLGIGDNTVDVYVDHDMQYPGGNAVNVAVQAARLGASASYLGCLGDDTRSALVERSLVAEGVDISHVRWPGGPNAFSRVGHRGNDRVFLGSDPGVRGRYRLTEADDAFIASHDIAHTSVHSDIDAELPRIRARIDLLSYDYSVHLDRLGKRATLALVDFAFLSSAGDDAECLDLLRSCAAEGPSLVVVTRGTRGACALAGGIVFEVAAHPAEIIDTLGAGDAFIAAFLMARMRGAEVPECLSAAAARAALACASRGAYGYGEPAGKLPPMQPASASSGIRV
jgi:fructoselysine 6-kinase